MVNQDLGFKLKQLSARISDIENRIGQVENNGKDNGDWDNSQLLQEWKVCKRTAANYRRNGLEFYKRGGRIYYTPASRAKFIQQQKIKINGSTK